MSDGPNILIALAERRLLFRQGTQVVAEYPVAIGKPATPTPLGEFSVLEKVMWPGGVFGARWMRFYADYGIHGTNQPELIGQAVSHGCVRMYDADIETLYPQVPYGAPVTIIAALPGRVVLPRA